MRQKRNRSLTTQLLLVITLMIAGAILLCLVLNITMLQRYYEHRKQNSMLESFRIFDEASSTGELYEDDYELTLEQICGRNNLNLLVMESDGGVILSSSNDNERMVGLFMNTIFGADGENDREVLVDASNYALLRETDGRLGTDYLVIWGTLEDGNLIMMRTPVESIRESAATSNRFLLIVGAISVVAAGIISVFISKHIAQPIVQLTDISKRMAELDFEAKYDGRHSVEIDELGTHMNQLSETLEQTISELKTANNELKIDIEKKEQIDEMRKEFLSNVSHELKTPLALIQGYAEGLQLSINEDAEEREYYCEVIIDEADKMNQMVKKLLSLNQLEFGNQMVSMARFELTELIRGVIEASRILAEQDGITILFGQSEPIYVWGDEFMIEEVVTNYLSNAIHHADGEKRITITCEQRDPYVHVSVANTGHQIPEEDLDKVWIKFYKVDKARTRAYGGSGIGLSIVKAIMDSHHCGYGVNNLPDGVEFWFELDTKSDEGTV